MNHRQLVWEYRARLAAEHAAMLRLTFLQAGQLTRDQAIEYSEAVKASITAQSRFIDSWIQPG